MKKILSIVFAVSILATTAFSNVSIEAHDKLVEEYLEVSGQGHAYSMMPTEMANMIEQQFVAEGEKAPAEVLNVLIEEFTKEETVEKMTADIRKISIEDLTKLITFYKTKVGQKCAAMNRSEGMEDMETKLPVFAQNLQQNPPSPHRIESMNTMFTETNVVTGSLKMIESMIRIFDANAPKDQQMTNEELDGLMVNMRPAMTNQLVLTFYYALRDFSDTEVDEIVKITLTKEGQAETDAQIAGLTSYFNLATENLVQAIKKL